ncbi:MAG: hypothetical protein QXL27_01010 [Candidatus Bathyarchaeia archaeon]
MGRRREYPRRKRESTGSLLAVHRRVAHAGGSIRIGLSSKGSYSAIQPNSTVMLTPAAKPPTAGTTAPASFTLLFIDDDKITKK